MTARGALPSPVHPLPTRRRCSRCRKPKVAILREEGSNSTARCGRLHAAGSSPGRDHDDLLAGRVSLEGFRGLAAVAASRTPMCRERQGLGRDDPLQRAAGGDVRRILWAADTSARDLQRLPALRAARLGAWRGIAPEVQPRFVHNTRPLRVALATVKSSPIARCCCGMEGLVFGIPVAHGREAIFPDAAIHAKCSTRGSRRRLRGRRRPTDRAVPLQPNGSPADHRPDDPGWPPPRDDAHPGVASSPGRRTGCRAPARSITASPWLRIFQNAWSGPGDQ